MSIGYVPDTSAPGYTEPTVTEEMFFHHVTETRNDLADWVRDCVGDLELAACLAEAKTLLLTELLVKRRVLELEQMLEVPPAVAAVEETSAPVAVKKTVRAKRAVVAVSRRKKVTA